MQVLILEEDSTLRTDIAAALAGAGCDVMAFGRLDPAKAAAREAPVDVLLLGEGAEGRLAHDLVLLAEWRNPGLAAILLSDRQGEGMEELFDLLPSLQAVVGRRTAPEMLARLALSAGRGRAASPPVATEVRPRAKAWDPAPETRDQPSATVAPEAAGKAPTESGRASAGVADPAPAENVTLAPLGAGSAAICFADGPAALARIQAGAARLAAEAIPAARSAWSFGPGGAVGTDRDTPVRPDEDAEPPAADGPEPDALRQDASAEPPPASCDTMTRAARTRTEDAAPERPAGTSAGSPHPGVPPASAAPTVGIPLPSWAEAIPDTRRPAAGEATGGEVPSHMLLTSPGSRLLVGNVDAVDMYFPSADAPLARFAVPLTDADPRPVVGSPDPAEPCVRPTLESRAPSSVSVAAPEALPFVGGADRAEAGSPPLVEATCPVRSDLDLLGAPWRLAEEAELRPDAAPASTASTADSAEPPVPLATPQAPEAGPAPATTVLRLAALVPDWDPRAELERRRAQLAARALRPALATVAPAGIQATPGSAAIPPEGRPTPTILPRRLHLA